MIEVAEHEAAEGERDAAERAPEPADAEHPSKTVQAACRQKVVGAPHQDERDIDRQEQQRQDVRRVEEPDLAIRHHRVAREDQRAPEREPAGRQLLRQPGGQRVVEGAGVALMADDSRHHEPPEQPEQR